MTQAGPGAPRSPANARHGAVGPEQAGGAVDISLLERWVGRTEEAQELLTPALAHRFATTLGGNADVPGDGGPAPLGIH